MAKSRRTPREEIERAFHATFESPEQGAAFVGHYVDQLLTQAKALTPVARPSWTTAATDRHPRRTEDLVVTPDPLRDLYGCRYCGEPATGHGTRYHHRVGLHQWQGPTPEQIHTRTRARPEAPATKEN